MATTIRDVLIKISIEQEQAALRVPDTHDYIAAIGGIETAIDGLEGHWSAAAEAADRALSRRAEVELDVSPLVAAAEKAEEWIRRIEEAIQQIGTGRVDLDTSSVDKAADDVEQQAQRIEAALAEGAGRIPAPDVSGVAAAVDEVEQQADRIHAALSEGTGNIPAPDLDGLTAGVREAADDVDQQAKRIHAALSEGTGSIATPDISGVREAVSTTRDVVEQLRADLSGIELPPLDIRATKPDFSAFDAAVADAVDELDSLRGQVDGLELHVPGLDLSEVRASIDRAVDDIDLLEQEMNGLDATVPAPDLSAVRKAVEDAVARIEDAFGEMGDVPAPDLSRTKTAIEGVVEEAHQLDDAFARIGTKPVPAPDVDALRSALDDVAGMLQETEDSLRELDAAAAGVDLPDFGGATSSAERYADAIEKAGQDTTSAGAKAADALAKWREEQEELQREIAEQHQKIQDEAVKTADGLVTAGEGALKFARGLTLLGVDAEDDMAVVIEQLARVQAAIDLLGGAKDVFKGIIEAVRSFRAVTQAATAANLALAASNAVVGESAKASAIKQVASSAGARVGTALLGGGGAAGAATGAGGGLAAIAAIAGPLAAVLGTVGVALYSVYETAELIRDQGPIFDEQAAAAERYAEQLATVRDLTQFHERFTQSLQRGRDFRDELRSLTVDETDLAARLLRIDQERAQSFRDLQRGARPGGDIETQLRLGHHEVNLANATALVQNNVEAKINADPTNPLVLAAGRARLEVLASEQERNIELDKERLAVLRQVDQEQERIVEKAKQEYELAEKAFKQERDRLTSLEERIGKLSPEDFIKLQRIAARAEKGEKLTLTEAEFLEQTGVGTEAAAKRFRQEAEKRGADKILENLGADDRFGTLVANLSRAKSERDRKLDQATDQAQLSVEEQGRTVERILGIMEKLNKSKASLARIERLEAEIERNHIERNGGT